MRLKIIILSVLFGFVACHYSSNICGKTKCSMPSCCPDMVSREDWAAKKSTDVHYVIIPVNYTIIHHTATPDCKTKGECIERVQSIQNYHLDIDFGDIGYNFLIGGDENLYEGLGWHRRGAHTYGYNSKSIGIAFIGDYTNKYPSEKQIQLAKDLIECSVKLEELSEDYKLLGARQVSPTASPGNKLYRELQTWSHWSSAP